MLVETLAKILKEAWSRETSCWPEKWTSENPALGQCFVTALIVQDFFGGEIIRAKVPGLGYHYFNRLPNGKEIDLTYSQFTTPVQMGPITVWPRKSRRKIKQMPQIIKRYQILKQRVEQRIKQLNS